MKNKFLKFLVFVCLFTFPFINVNALFNKSDDLSYVKYDEYLEKYIYNISQNNFCINDGVCLDLTDRKIFPFATINDMHVYYLYLNNIPNTINKDNSNYDYNIDSMLYSVNETSEISKMTEKKEKLLDSFLSNVYQLDEGDNLSEILQHSRNNIKLLVNQIIVWEIMYSVRTNFDDVEPTYTESDSFYTSLILKNKDLKNEYINTLENVKNSENLNLSLEQYSTEDNPLLLTKNIRNNTYSAKLYNVNEYSKLESKKLNIEYDSSDKSFLLETKNYFDSENVEVSNTVGQTREDLQDFNYYKITKKDENNYKEDTYNIVNYFVLAAKGKIYKQDIYLKCSEGPFSIYKVDGNTGAQINGAVFQIKSDDGNIIKFDQSENLFSYNETGSTDTIEYQQSNRYDINNLPRGNYSIIEIKSPDGYDLNESENKIEFEIRGSEFLIKNENGKYQINNERIIRIKNYKKKTLIIPSGEDGKFLTGAEYQLYDSNKNLVPLVYDETTKTYRYSTSGSTDLKLVVNNSGTIPIEGLPKGKYYLCQISAPEGFSLESTCRELNIGDSNNSQVITVPSAKGEFNFYKIDENGKYLSGGTFTLQKYNDQTGAYEDVKLSKVEKENSNSNIYKIDENGNIVTFETKNGIATFQNVLANSKYRIVELETPEGYQMIDKEPASAIVEINNEGYAKTSATIINKKIIVSTDATSNAELIVSINTGQVVIKYGIIIVTFSTILIILFVLRKKLRK